MEKKFKFRWVQKVEKAQTKIQDVYVLMKGDADVLFYEVEVNGEPQLIPNLQGYALIPRDEYDRLRGGSSRFPGKVAHHDPQDVLPK